MQCLFFLITLELPLLVFSLLFSSHFFRLVSIISVVCFFNSIILLPVICFTLEPIFSSRVSRIYLHKKCSLKFSASPFETKELATALAAAFVTLLVRFPTLPHFNELMMMIQPFGAARFNLSHAEGDKLRCMCVSRFNGGHI